MQQQHSSGRARHARRRTVVQATLLSIIGIGNGLAQNLAQTLAPVGNLGPELTGAAASSSMLSFDPADAPPGQDSLSKAAPIGRHHFTIPPGELTTALEAYGRITGIHVHSALPADKLTGFRTPGVQGDLGDGEALHRLLEHTGLDGSFVEPTKVELSIRNAEHVEVTASIAQVGLQQFPQSLIDTPQTVSVVPQYIMNEQADTTLRDSLRNVPGISIAAGEGGAQGDSFTIRGFNARNDIYLDGIRDFGSYYRDSFDFQSVDVLEGPASVEFGRGSTGGVVNQESKAPELTPFIGGNFQFGTDAMRRGSLDIDRPIAAIPGGTAFRLNAAAEESGVAARDITDIRRFGVAPSLVFGLSTKTRLNIAYLHEGEDSIPDYGLPYFGAGVAAVPRTTYYGIASANYLRTSPDFLTARVDHDFGLHLTLRNTLRWGNYGRDFRITEPQINSAASVMYTNADGRNVYEGPTTGIGVRCAVTSNPATSCYAFNTPLSQVFVNRNEIAGHSVEDILWDQVSVTGRFTVGHIANNAVVLIEGGRERSNPNRPAYNLPYVSALNPSPYDAFAPTQTYTGVTTHVASQSYGVDFLDTLELTHWLQVSGGVRFDYFQTTSFAPANPGGKTPTAAAFAERLDKQPTYRAAVVVKPTSAGSVYFDWGTSFNPAAESLSLSGNNATSPPEYNQTFELGAKWGFLHDRLNLNGSVFRTEKLNARETDPNNSVNVLNAGNQLVRGVQLGALGHLPSSFDLILGYAFLDGRVESSALNASPFAAVNTAMCSFYTHGINQNCAAAVLDPRFNTAPFYLNPAGFPLANVPKNSGNLWVTHKLLYGFTGGFGGSYVGARRASSTAGVGVYNTQSVLDPSLVPVAFKAVPGYTLLSLMVRRPITDRISLQANIANLTNAFFIDQPHPAHLVPGEGRNAQFGLNYKF